MAKTKSEAPVPPKELKDIDYTKLTGETLEKYLAIVASLDQEKYYDFEYWMAKGDLKYRINEDSGEKELYLKGIILNGSAPRNVTRIAVKFANDLNASINDPSIGHLNSKYLLLKKGE